MAGTVATVELNVGKSVVEVYSLVFDEAMSVVFKVETNAKLATVTVKSMVLPDVAAVAFPGVTSVTLALGVESVALRAVSSVLFADGKSVVFPEVGDSTVLTAEEGVVERVEMVGEVIALVSETGETEVEDETVKVSLP